MRRPYADPTGRLASAFSNVQIPLSAVHLGMQKLVAEYAGVGNAVIAGCAQAWKEHVTELEGAPMLSQALQHLGSIRRSHAHATVSKNVL